MTPISIAILLCLLLAVGATVASCLIPELTIVGGIWGIPVLGFALLVGVIFRIAVYYDPREPQSPDTKKYAGYVAGSLLCYLVAWSSLDLMFPKGQHIATSIGSILGVLTILGILTFCEYEWVMKTTANIFPVIFEIKRFVFFNSSSLYLLACVFRIEELRNVVKPVVIFFAYANCVSFAAVYFGTYIERRIFASNGTIAERMKAWFRSIIEQGEIFFIIDITSLLLSILMHVIVMVGNIPAKFHLLPKAFFAVVVGIMCYTASRCDPRKPPEGSNRANRVVSLFVYFAVEIYLGIYMEFILLKDDPYAFEVHSVALIALLLVRVLLTIHLIFREIAVENRINRKVLTNLVYISLYTLASVYFVLMNIVRPKISLEYEVGRILASTFYYIATMSILTVIAGKYREAVGLVRPHLVQAHHVQCPPEIVVDQGERRQPSVNV
jgi:hypothetical protein